MVRTRLHSPLVEILAARFTVYASRNAIRLSISPGCGAEFPSPAVESVLCSIPRWAIVSPWLTRKGVDEQENLHRWQEMRLVLFRSGVEFTDSLAQISDRRSPAFMIHAVPEVQIVALARRFDQSGVLWFEHRTPSILDVGTLTKYPCQLVADRVRANAESTGARAAGARQLRFTLPPPPAVGGHRPPIA